MQPAIEGTQLVILQTQLAFQESRMLKMEFERVRIEDWKGGEYISERLLFNSCPFIFIGLAGYSGNFSIFADV